MEISWGWRGQKKKKKKKKKNGGDKDDLQFYHINPILAFAINTKIYNNNLYNT